MSEEIKILNELKEYLQSLKTLENPDIKIVIKECLNIIDKEVIKSERGK